MPVLILVPKFESQSQIELTADYGAAGLYATCERLIRAQITLSDETKEIRPALELQSLEEEEAGNMFTVI